MSKSQQFGFFQLEFGFLLGPPDGRYVVRHAPGGGPTEVLLLATLGAPERRRLKGRRRPRAIEDAAPEPVPTSRATVIKAKPFASKIVAEAWLDRIRRDGEAVDVEADAAITVLNRALRAHRLARADAYVRDVSLAQALVARIGIGSGEALATGGRVQTYELPPWQRAPAGRGVDQGDERFVAILGANDQPLACEELVLRASDDAGAERDREAALQARIALEALLAEYGDRLLPEQRSELEGDRDVVAAAANAALRGPIAADLIGELHEAIGRMELVLRSRR